MMEKRQISYTGLVATSLRVGRVSILQNTSLIPIGIIGIIPSIG